MSTCYLPRACVWIEDRKTTFRVNLPSIYSPLADSFKFKLTLGCNCFYTFSVIKSKIFEVRRLCACCVNSACAQIT